jgi:hypothetical protein
MTLNAQQNSMPEGPQNPQMPPLGPSNPTKPPTGPHNPSKPTRSHG